MGGSLRGHGLLIMTWLYRGDGRGEGGLARGVTVHFFSSFFSLFSSAYERIDMNPFLLSPMSGLQSYLHFSVPGGSHKSERTRYFLFTPTSC